MKVTILSEAGYSEALFGLGLSHGVTSGLVFENVCSIRKSGEPEWRTDEYKRMEGVAQKLAGKGLGHDKFTRMIQVWLDVTASLTWWKQADTYRIGTTVQSSSTMHTLHKTPITQKLFDVEISIGQLKFLEDLRQCYNETKDMEVWESLIGNLPNSFLQRRIVNCNYAVLANIIYQRRGHKLGAWAIFITAIRSQAQHPELLP